MIGDFVSGVFLGRIYKDVFVCYALAIVADIECCPDE
jgi:hypothetical protein